VCFDGTQVYGDPEGKHLCFWFHGTPSCRLEAHGLSEDVLKQLSIKVRAARHSFDHDGMLCVGRHPVTCVHRGFGTIAGGSI